MLLSFVVYAAICGSGIFFMPNLSYIILKFSGFCRILESLEESNGQRHLWKEIKDNTQSWQKEKMCLNSLQKYCYNILSFSLIQKYWKCENFEEFSLYLILLSTLQDKMKTLKFLLLVFEKYMMLHNFKTILHWVYPTDDWLTNCFIFIICNSHKGRTLSLYACFFFPLVL